MTTAKFDRWMESVSAKIKNTPLCMLPVPGSHDAGAYGTINKRSKAQGMSITQQLTAGFRYFDFRVMVNNGVYYAVHGGDTTDNNYTAVKGARSGLKNKRFILDDIANFLATRPGELVILNFSHFSAHGSQDFNADDKKNFGKLLKDHFGTKLVPRFKKPTVTYGACIAAGQQVVAIVEDDNDWYEYSGVTSAGLRERRQCGFWSAKDCFKDRYSDYYVDLGGGPAVDNLQGKIDKTMVDQERYLLQPGPGVKDHRDLKKFWVTQAVLNYAAVVYKGSSQNRHGAEAMNKKFTAAYKNYWSKGKLSQLKGYVVGTVQAPNILLFDYAGYYDGFPEACVQMARAKKSPTHP